MQILTTSDSLSLILESESETDHLGRCLASEITPNRVIGLIGPLGAGKTRLSRAISEALGVDPLAIASPTYVLILEYEGAIPVYHFDTYRLDSADDFDALGVEEYWSAGGVCLVEWADRVLDRLPADSWIIRIEPDGGSRRVELRIGEGPIRDRIAASLERDPG